MLLSEGFESYDPGIPRGIPPDWYIHLLVTEEAHIDAYR